MSSVGRPRRYATNAARQRAYRNRKRTAPPKKGCAMVSQEVVIGNCRLILGDCYALLPTLEADALISDPPYGINFDCTKVRRRNGGGLRGARHHAAPWQTNVIGDDTPFDPRPWLHFRQIILWGAHLYAGSLPRGTAWLVWDKREGTASDDQGDCELAWTNLPGVTRVHRQLWRGLVRRGEENLVFGPKLHPMQKPIALMRWCVAKTSGVVLDPFAGSFTTAQACVELGRPCIAIEIDPELFEAGCRRIAAASAQLPLLPPPRPRPSHQGALF